MTTVQTLAQAGADGFEHATRDDGSGYYKRKDDAPQWLADLIQDAHGDMFPDDWRYEAIYSALSYIADNDADEDGANEFADGATDVYNSALIAWVGSHGSRGGYVDDAREEFGEARDFYHGLQMGQYMELSEVYGSVMTSLQALEEDDVSLEDEEVLA